MTFRYDLRIAAEYKILDAADAMIALSAVVDHPARVKNHSGFRPRKGAFLRVAQPITHPS
ncbi:MAG TPA: hypothetical protein VNL74_10560 [Methylococcus sp.]|nr:hypothetical protein [Methylococcus sp.]